MPKIEKPANPLIAKLQGLHLFHFDAAPCAQRVRFALAEKGLVRGADHAFMRDDASANCSPDGVWTSRLVSLVKKEHLSEAYAQIHPDLVIPALVHDGQLYLESMDIIEYLDDAFGGTPIIPQKAEDQAEARKMTQWAKDLHRSIRFVTFRWGLRGMGKLSKQEEDKLRMLVRDAKDGEQLLDFYEGFDSGSFNDDLFLNHLRLLVDAFNSLEKRLASGQAFLIGDDLSMADIIWSMKLNRLLECGYPLKTQHPKVHEWYQRMYRRPGFQIGVMAKHRGLNRAFRIKAGFENIIGIGLASAVRKIAA